MRKILCALGSIGAILFSACGGKGKSDKSASVERDSTFTNVKHPEWSRNAVAIYEVNLRQYTDSGTVTAFAREPSPPEGTWCGYSLDDAYPPHQQGWS